MPERRHARHWVVGILGGVAVVIALFAAFPRPRHTAVQGPAAPVAAAPGDSDSGAAAALNEGLRNSDPRALEALQTRLTADANAPRTALSEADGAYWLETLNSLRAGFFRFSGPGKATSAVVACKILNKFAVEPAPARWIEALAPVRDLLVGCLSDDESNVRYIALGQVGGLWVWMPGRSLMRVEENELGNWKESLHRPVLRCLASKDLRSRIGAIACLGTLPIDTAAAPAVPYLDDRDSVDVRRQTLVSFAQRPTLLTEDMLLRRLHDEDQSIRETATLILKARGLNQELISLGGLLVSPKPQQRASVITLIKSRTDIDPIVWLIQLSHDTDESVRIHAVNALAEQKNTPISVKRRIAEMARSDASQQVRQAASKFVPSIDETTAALPPLPGSPSLNPKAN